VLKTTLFYGKERYEQMNADAAANGITLLWAHLRLIADRLANHSEEREQIEEKLVTTRMTVNQLEEEIDKLVPNAKRQRKQNRSHTERLTEAAKQIERFLGYRETISEVLTSIEQTFAAEEGEGLLEQTSALLGMFESLREFAETHTEKIQTLHDTICNAVHEPIITTAEETNILADLAKIM
jgi:uncharacterized coiled-coil DUF342 family protein